MAKQKWRVKRYSDFSALLTTFNTVDSYAGGMSATSLGRTRWAAYQLE